MGQIQDKHTLGIGKSHSCFSLAMKRFAGAHEVAVPRSVPQEPCLIDGHRGIHHLPEAVERPQTSWVLAVVLDVLPGGIWPHWDPLPREGKDGGREGGKDSLWGGGEAEGRKGDTFTVLDFEIHYFQNLGIRTKLLNFGMWNLTPSMLESTWESQILGIYLGSPAESSPLSKGSQLGA